MYVIFLFIMRNVQCYLMCLGIIVSHFKLGKAALSLAHGKVSVLPVWFLGVINGLRKQVGCGVAGLIPDIILVLVPGLGGYFDELVADFDASLILIEGLDICGVICVIIYCGIHQMSST